MAFFTEITDSPFQGIVPREYGTLGGRGLQHHHHQRGGAEPAYQDLQQGFTRSDSKLNCMIICQISRDDMMSVRRKLTEPLQYVSYFLH